MRDRTLGLRGILLELRQIAIALLKNPQIGLNPFVAVHNMGRATWGLVIALSRMLRGPRRINTLDSRYYRESKLERAAE
jgi:hypothetical protein